MISALEWAELDSDEASMGPPREHGGMEASAPSLGPITYSLQWGRRVNTAECCDELVERHGGTPLQWGRRVNTAECYFVERDPAAVSMLQWGRRVNTAECESGQAVRPSRPLLQWGRRVNTAECAKARHRQRDADCFNGAAA